MKKIFLIFLTLLIAGCTLKQSSVSLAPQMPALVVAPPNATATMTPFQPLPPTQALGTPYATATAFPPTATPNPNNWNGIRFDQEEWITITIHPANGADPVEISFIPGSPCPFGNQHGCVYVYGQTIHVQVHSGRSLRDWTPGEGEAWRNFLEGSGIGNPVFSLDEIHQNMKKLQGSRVIIQQGDKKQKVFVLSIFRIPANRLAEYFTARNSDVEKALQIAALDNDLPELPSKKIVIETCGWPHRQEEWAEGVSNSTGSIYLTVLKGE